MVGYWRVLICVLFVSFSGYLAHGSQPPDLTPAEWAAGIAKKEIPALENHFRKFNHLQQISPQTFLQASNLLNALKIGLKTETNDAGMRTQGLRYVALTDLMVVIELGGLCGKNCPPALQEASKLAVSLITVLAGPVVEGTHETLLKRLRTVEAMAESAQKEILRDKQQEAAKSLAMRIESLQTLQPSDALTKAARALREGISLLSQNREEAGQAKLAEASSLVFGAKAELWDGRHLYQFLQLKLLSLTVMRSELIDQSERASISTQMAVLDRSIDDSSYDGAAAELQDKLKGIIAKKKLNENDNELPLYVSPEAVRASLAARLKAMSDWIPEARRFYEDNETTLQWMNYEHKYKLLGILGNLEAQLHTASLHLARTDQFKTIHAMNRSIQFFQTVTAYTIEAVLERSNSAPKYMAVWQRGLNRMMRGDRFMSDADMHELQQALKIERREGIRSAWLNRRNATVAAVSVLLAAEAISIPFTGGGSAAAMPATLATITTVSVVSAKTVLLASSALNISDRAKIHGVSGLANMDTAFDVMIILSLAPRPMVGGTAAATTVGKITQFGAKRLAQFQYSSAALLSISAPAYGAYLVYNSESIAREMEKDGITVTADEVARRGWVNIALGIVAYGTNAAYYRQGVKTNGKDFEKAIEPGTFVGGTLKSWGNKINQPGALMTYRANNPGAWGAMKTVGLGAGYAAFDYLLGTEVLLLSFANLDSNYLNHSYSEHRLPDLRDGESAVVLIGFDPSDYFLWAGAKARYSHRREIAKYGEKLLFYDYKSPDDFLAILAKHRQKHGPIRFMKIATHGRPGMLYTREVWGSPEEKLGGGWINANYLNGNKADLQKLAREIFAPDARFLFWACLTGTNLDNASDGQGKDAGEQFLNTVGEVLLVNGGAIDASTRVLMGWEATVGVLGDHLHREGFRTMSGGRPRLVIPVSPLVTMGPNGEALDGAPQAAPDALPEDETPDVLNVGKSLARRLIGIYTDMPPVWWKYGFNLEGPHWASPYYRYLEVKPH